MAHGANQKKTPQQHTAPHELSNNGCDSLHISLGGLVTPNMSKSHDKKGEPCGHQNTHSPVAASCCLVSGDRK